MSQSKRAHHRYSRTEIRITDYERELPYELRVGDKPAGFLAYRRELIREVGPSRRNHHHARALSPVPDDHV